MADQEWLDGEMRDGIRKIRNKRETKRAGSDVFAFKVPYRNTAGKQTSETFSTVRAAERFRDKVRNMRNEGVVIDVKAGKMSVEAYAAEWLVAAAQKREGTYTRYESYMRMHIVPALGERQLRAVTRTDIQAFVNDLVGKGLAARTVQAVYKTTAALFRSAHLLDNKITTSPCVGIVLPEIPDREVRILTVRQVRSFAAAMPGRWRAAMLLAAGTGLRVSEILGLTWDRVDLEAGLVKVDRQMALRRRFGPVKTRRSRRTVPSPPASWPSSGSIWRTTRRVPRTSRTSMAQQSMA